MKKNLVVVLGMLSFSWICAAGELHEFRSFSGKSVKAEIMDYNGRMDEVTLRLPNRRIRKVKPSVFIEADQEYIKKWSLIDGFKNSSKLRMEINKKAGDFRRLEGRRGSVAKTRKTRYDIVVENLNSYPMEKISVEYKIFLKPQGDGQWHSELVGLLGSRDELQNPSPVSGARWCEKIPAGGKILFETKFARSVKAKPTSRPDSSGNVLKNQAIVLEGIWVRLVMELDGKKIARDVFAPDTLEGKHEWE